MPFRSLEYFSASFDSECLSDIIAPSLGPRGGIGRRAWFRSMCRKVWGFESLRGHQLLKREFAKASSLFLMPTSDAPAGIVRGTRSHRRQLRRCHRIIALEGLMNPRAVLEIVQIKIGLYHRAGLVPNHGRTDFCHCGKLPIKVILYAA